MKSPELFWAVVAAYNEATWAMQLVLLAVGAVLTGTALARPTRAMQAALKGFLAVAFAWLAVTFFFLRDASPIGHYFAGPLFVACAALFAWDIRARRSAFALPVERWRRIGTWTLLALTLLYPLVSFLLGHRYPRLTTPVMPCPLTVYALALLTAAFPQVDKRLYALLLVWAALGLPKVFGLFDVREDTILFAAGVYSALVWMLHLTRSQYFSQSDADKR